MNELVTHARRTCNENGTPAALSPGRMQGAAEDRAAGDGRLGPRSPYPRAATSAAVNRSENEMRAVLSYSRLFIASWLFVGGLALLSGSSAAAAQ